MATTTPALLTLEEFMNLPETDMQQEICEGELIEMAPPKSAHSRCLIAFQYSLYAWAAGTGRSVLPETAYTLSVDPATVRVPDVSVIETARWDAAPPDGYVSGAPDLAIEVVSPSNSIADLTRKTAQYLRYGSKAVIVANPRTKEVHLHTQDSARVFRPGDIVAAAEAAPGWSINVSDLF